MSELSFQEKHTQAWSMLFQTQKFTSIANEHGVNLAIMGQDLYSKYNHSDLKGTHPAYLVLIIGENRELRFHSKTFFESLAPHTFNPATNEVFFQDSNITLNIHDILEAPELIALELQKLFSCHKGDLRSAYLFYHDNSYALRSVESSNIIGPRGKVSSLRDVSIMCALALEQPQDAIIRDPQMVFCIQDIHKPTRLLHSSNCPVRRNQRPTVNSISYPLYRIEEE
jgi:hypothetical protein